MLVSIIYMELIEKVSRGGIYMDMKKEKSGNVDVDWCF